MRRKRRASGRKPGEWKLLTPEKLREFRETNNVSRAKLARLVGVSATSIQNWDTGRLPPGRGYQAKLVEIMSRPELVDRLPTRSASINLHAVQEAELQATGQIVLGWLKQNPKATLDELTGIVRAVRRAFRT